MKRDIFWRDFPGIQTGITVIGKAYIRIIFQQFGNFQVTPFPLYGGIILPLVIGAVVEGVPATFQIPLSEHFVR
ncbi:hypothetical protein HMPREF0484_0972 [Klebsiella pneumoniae subsp. rhinoscleromatis ATCC 13884]|nr:hypothetical protein HMPREF0484_0972 [Klebsiella pneumoniae subsp. rhinoscleromatis ATCC 13884]